MSSWRFRRDSLLKQYLVEHLPENENPVFGFSLTDITTPGKVIAGLELIFTKNEMYGKYRDNKCVYCDTQLAYIVGSLRIGLIKDKLHLKRIVYSHLIETPVKGKQTEFISTRGDFPPLSSMPHNNARWAKN
jgi:hypothetical protein